MRAGGKCCAHYVVAVSAAAVNAGTAIHFVFFSFTMRTVVGVMLLSAALVSADYCGDKKNDVRARGVSRAARRGAVAPLITASRGPPRVPASAGAPCVTAACVERSMWLHCVSIAVFDFADSVAPLVDVWRARACPLSLPAGVNGGGGGGNGGVLALTLRYGCRVRI